MKPVHEQTIVITGASSGIGRVTAKEAAKRGAKVVVSARSSEELERLAAEIRSDGGVALAVPADVTVHDQVVELARRAAGEFGGIDTWVNNAGVSVYATFEETSLEDFRRVMETNFMGQIYGAKAALPYLKESAGALVCVGSVLSDRGVPLLSAYCASKHAIKGWIDALRTELQKERSGVRVTLVKPTSINTPLFDHARTQLGVKPQGFPPIYAPELVAEAILHAAQAEARDLYVGDVGKAMSMMERVSPRLVDLQQLKMGYEMQQTEEPKAADAPNNLYTPIPGADRGSFTDREQQWSLYPAVSEKPWGIVLAIAAGAVCGLLAASQAARSDNSRSVRSALGSPGLSPRTGSRG